MRRVPGLAKTTRAAAACAVLGLLSIGACSPKKLVVPNLPPETTLFVQIPNDGGDHDANHVLHLFWFGTDPDGEIRGFEWRFFNPRIAADTGWRFTTKTDSIFEVFADTTRVLVRFEVRALDNQGLRDPSPARQDPFDLRNRAPTAALASPPGALDSTFASLTLSWVATDPDGDAIRYLVWLDGNQGSPHLISTKTFTFPSEDFCENGEYVTRMRTAFVQPIDNGGLAGATVSVTWPVRAPVGARRPCGLKGPLLIVDDVPETSPGNSGVDRLYRSAAVRNAGADSFNVLKMSPRQPFRSAKDVEQTFKQFTAVLWYRDFQTTTSAPLRDYVDGIGEYLKGGGSFYIEGLDLVPGHNTPPGPLRADWARTFLHVQGLESRFDSTSFDRTDTWTNVPNTVFRTTIRFGVDSTYQDILTLGTNVVGGAQIPNAPPGSGAGIRAFTVSDTADVALWAPQGSLACYDYDRRRTPIGLSVKQHSGGRAFILTVPLRFAAAAGTNVDRFLDRVLLQFGIHP